MLKRDNMGLLRLCAEGCILLFFMLFVIKSLPPLLSTPFTRVSAILYGIFLLCILLGVMFWYIKNFKRWRHTENMRKQPELLALYDPQPAIELAYKRQGVPTGIKRQSLRFPIGGAGISVFVIIILLFRILFIALFISRQLISPWQLAAAFGLAIGILAVIFLITTGIIIIRDYLHIEANERGLTIQKGLLRGFMPWDEARFFAIGPPDSKGSRWIELSSTHTLLRWPYIDRGTGKPGPDLALYFIQMSDEPSVYLSATKQEYELELMRLQSYVKWKTNLPLCELHI